MRGLAPTTIPRRRFIVVNKLSPGATFSAHYSRASALAEKRWRWERKYPELLFDVLEV